MFIDFSFWLFSAADVPLGPVGGLPPFLRVTVHERKTEPALFALDARLAGAVDRDALASVARARRLYVVRCAVPERLDDDAHLQLAIQAAAQVARAASALVVDPHAMRAMSAAAFAETCTPDLESHVTYAIEGRFLASRGMIKFGEADVAIDVSGVAPKRVDSVAPFLDAACRGLVARTFSPGVPFELAQASWIIEPRTERSLLRATRESLAEVLARMPDARGT
jgi:hypothetical protein